MNTDYIIHLYGWSALIPKISIVVDQDELRRLGKRFRKLDTDNSGTLSIEEFMSLPELQQNPLVQRVIEIFDTDGNKEIDFQGEFFILFDSQFTMSEQLTNHLFFHL